LTEAERGGRDKKRKTRRNDQANKSNNVGRAERHWFDDHGRSTTKKRIGGKSLRMKWRGSKKTGGRCGRRELGIRDLGCWVRNEEVEKKF